MNDNLLAATTIAKYTVCQSQVYLNLVLNDPIWEKNNKSLIKGVFYHDFRNYYNKSTQNRTDLLDRQRLCRQSLLEAYRFADINNFSSFLPTYTLQIESRLNEEISKHNQHPVIFSEESYISKKYGIKGRIDAVVEYDDYIIPWDYKTGYDPIFLEYNKVQIICYCLLLQDNKYDSPFGVIDYVDQGLKDRIKFTSSNKKHVLEIIKKINNMLVNRTMPKLFQCNYYKYDGSCLHCYKLSEVYE